MVPRSFFRGVLFLSIGLVFFPLLSCSSVHPGSVDRAVAGTYDQVFQATYEVLREQGFSMERVDRKRGRLVTERRPIQATSGPRPVERVDARIKESDGAVEVRLLLSFEDQVSGGPKDIPRQEAQGNERHRTRDVAAEAVSRSVRAGAVYDRYLDAIEKRISALQGPRGS